MMNAIFTSSRIIVGWIAAVVLLVGASVALDARVSTTALVFVLGMAPVGLFALLAHSAPSPSVSHLFYALRAKDR